jgi:hypothetical protein
VIAVQFFPYRFDVRSAAMWLPFGVIPGRDGVTLRDDRFRATFGFFNLETPLDTSPADTSRSTTAGTRRSASGCRSSMTR